MPLTIMDTDSQTKMPPPVRSESRPSLRFNPARLSIFAGLFLLNAAPLHAATFEQQRSAVAASLETQSEEAIVALLRSGIEENRPAPAVSLAS